MSDQKKEIRWFSIMDYEKEAEYLSRKQKEGWKFKRVTFPGIYTFERCEPEDTVYQLDYNPDSVKHQNEYIQMFQDCGWEYVLDFNGYSYFRKSKSQMQQDEKIFCDDASREDLVKRIFRGKVVPLFVIFIGLIIQLSMTISGRTTWDRRITIAFEILIVLYLIVFVQFLTKYISFRRRTGR